MDYNGYAATMILVGGAFAAFVIAIRGEIKDVYKVFVSLKNGTSAKEQ